MKRFAVILLTFLFIFQTVFGFSGKQNVYASGDALESWAQVATGDYHTVAIKGDGSLWAWGRNGNGEIGDGTKVNKKIPTKIGSDNTWVDISAGNNHTIALKSDGTLWTWGLNHYGQLGMGDTTARLVPTQMGTDTDWASVTAGLVNSYAIKSNGDLWAWGCSYDGRLGIGPLAPGLEEMATSPMLIGSEWLSVAAGDRHAIGMKADHTLWAWGYNDKGQLGVDYPNSKFEPTKVGADSDWRNIAAGSSHSMAIKSDGSLWGWGYNWVGQLGDGTQVDKHSPIPIGSEYTWSLISANAAHTLALKTDGTLWGWGQNSEGELGLGNKNTPIYPRTQIGASNNWSKISAGNLHSTALKTDGSLWVWGNNEYNQLGDDTATGKLIPTQMPPQVSFQSAVNYGIGGQPYAITSGDFNRDTITDLAVTNGNTNNFSILLGTGDGTFGLKIDYGPIYAPQWITTGLFNNDDILDLAVTNSEGLNVFTGDGNGAFSNRTTYVAGTSPNTVVTADFNGDGRMDLVVSNYHSDNVSVYLQTGGGTYGLKTDFGVGDGPSRIVASDFNYDGKIDLAVVNDYASTVSILMGDGGGFFSSRTDYAAGSKPIGIAATDVNGDNKIDLMICNFDTSFDLSGNVTLLKGGGDGSFSKLSDLEVSDGPVGIVSGDFNGDGKADLAVTNRYRSNVSILCGNGSGGFSKQNFAVGSDPMNLILGDFNGDGKADVAVVDYGESKISILLGASDDQSVPTWSGGSVLTTSNVEQTTLKLTWSGATDNVGITGYKIFKDGVLYATVGNLLTTNITGLTAGAQYTFKVEARDAAGNWSSTGPSATVTMLANSVTPPDAPIISPGGGSFNSTTSAAITGSGGTIYYTTDNSAPTTSSAIYTTPFELSQTTTVKAAVYNSSTGWSSVVSATFTILGASDDTSVPTWSSGTVLTTSNVEQTSLDLTWPGATDNVGVSGYKIYKDGILYKTVGNLLTTGVTGLTAGTQYTFKVEARDAAGNWSSTGPSTTVTTLANSVTSSSGRGPSDGGTTISGSVIDVNGTQVSNVTATVTTDSQGNYSLTMNAARTVMLKQPDGTMSSLSDLSKVTFVTAAGLPVTVSNGGTINLKNLAKGTDNIFDIKYDLGNGQTITIGTMDIKVSNNGKVNLTCTLIDPYGVIIDAATGKPIVGANVTLYYANTDRNKTNGKTPGTVVPLPGIEGFKPNNNLNPQISDVTGAYGFMVYPTTDYYLVATKDGYNNYTSPIISVEQDIVRWDFKMNQTTSGVTRLSGISQVDTALAIAKANYTGTLSNVILATADNYPDALAGSVLAYKLNAPILLVGSLDADQEKVLNYMKSNLDPAGTVYILGGTAVVNSAMEGKVAACGFTKITRLGGTDRYETSVKIAEQLKVETGTPIVLAYGENYPDALSISSIAAEMQYPILLVQKDGLSDAIKQGIAAIMPTKVYIIGGEGVIGTPVEGQVAQITSLDKSKIVRIAGTDRYETSLAVAKYFDLAGQSVCIATGNNFPDALAGSVYAANYNIPIILADSSLSDQVINYLKTKKLNGGILFGGEAVISKDIERQLVQLIEK